jgi:NTP pyrophosphatase (non-canonical NTP hydrolase)
VSEQVYGDAYSVTFRLTARGVCEEVLGERELQDAKWGEQNHDPFTWLAILGEEVGEANKAALEAWTSGGRAPERLAEYRAELVQVAAVAVAMIQSLDRGKAPTFPAWRSEGPPQ